jgi:hypothetical protein
MLSFLASTVLTWAGIFHLLEFLKDLLKVNFSGSSQFLVFPSKSKLFLEE